MSQAQPKDDQYRSLLATYYSSQWTQKTDTGSVPETDDSESTQTPLSSPRTSTSLQTWDSFIDFADNDDLERLIPRNPAARVAFRQVAQLLDGEQTPDTEYLARYMCVIRSSYEYVNPPSPSPSAYADETDDEGPVCESELPLVLGYFRFAQDQPGQVAGATWWFGKGRPDEAIEFPLCLRIAKKIKGKHGYFQRKSDGIYLCADREDLRVDDTYILRRQSGRPGGKLRLRNGCVITAGPYEYTFVCSQREEVLISRAAWQDGATETPAATINIRDYKLGPAFLQSSTCLICEATDASGRVCVIKRPVKSSPDDTRHEIAMLRLLKHPHIIELKDVFSFGAIEEFLVFPKLTTLNEMMAKPVTHDLEDQVRTGLKQLSGALSFMHEKQYMHRDVKPHNFGVLASNSSWWKLFDFGTVYQGLSSDDHKKGTVRYLAPEVLILKREVRNSLLNRSERAFEDLQQYRLYDAKVDVWGLGLSFVEYLRGVRVKDWDHAIEEVSAFRRDATEDPLQKMLVRMTAFNPSQRWSMKRVKDVAASWL